MLVKIIPEITQPGVEADTLVSVYMDTKGYCVKCKVTRTIAGGKNTTTSDGKLALAGKCKICGTKMMKHLRVGFDILLRSENFLSLVLAKGRYRKRS